MKRQKLYGLCAAAVLSLSLAGCTGAESDTAQTQHSTIAQDSQQTNLGDMDTADTEEATADVTETNDAESENTDSVDVSDSDMNQKLIRTFHINAETKKFDSLIQTLKEKISDCNGYIESSQLNGGHEDDGNRSASYTIRIPEKKADDFLKTTEDNAHIIYREENTQDVTLDYVDTKSHIESLRIEQEALLKLLEKATKLSDIYSIQSELTNVRYQIESYESQLRTMDNQVKYVTIELDITEVEKETIVKEPTYLEEVKDRFQTACEDMVHALRAFSLWLISASPSLLLLAIFIVIGRLIWKKWQKHRKKKPARQPVYPMMPYGSAAPIMSQNPPVAPMVPPVAEPTAPPTDSQKDEEQN